MVNHLNQIKYIFSSKVCQWLAAGWWFSPVSSTNKIERQDKTEILLKVALNTNPIQLVILYSTSCIHSLMYPVWCSMKIQYFPINPNIILWSIPLFTYSYNCWRRKKLFYVSMSQVIKLIPIFIYLHKTLNRLGSRILKKYTCKSIYIDTVWFNLGILDFLHFLSEDNKYPNVSTLGGRKAGVVWSLQPS